MMYSYFPVMLKLTIVYLWLYLNDVSSQEECTDLKGLQVSHGLHYVPGPDTCYLCVCNKGQPKDCKAVLCSPPQNCRSFRVGNTCCEFICLDDVVKPGASGEPNFRMVAGAAAASVLIAVALLVYRVRRMKRRRPHSADDQRSLTSIGYISGSLAGMGEGCTDNAWKHLPRGEAPPPYDEAIRSRPMTAMTPHCRAHLYRMSESVFGGHRTFPVAGDTYVAVAQPTYQLSNGQECFAPLLPPPVLTDPRENIMQNQHQILPGYRLVGALTPPSPRLTRPPPSLHRTIPRISTAIDTTMLDNSLYNLMRNDRSLHNEIRRSFHKPLGVNAALVSQCEGRSVPRNLNLLQQINFRDGSIEDARRISSVNRSRAQSVEHNVGAENKLQSKQNKQQMPPTAQQAPQTPALEDANPENTLPLTVDKPSCVCSYEPEAQAVNGEELDDFRVECENCKSTHSSRWVLEEDGDWDEGARTQTLQRVGTNAPPPTAPPAASTLPQPVKRPTMSPPANWENWFHNIPDSDTESEE